MNYDSELPRSGFVSASWLKRYLAISNSTLYAWQSSGILPRMVAVGPRAKRFRAEDIRRYEEERMAGN